MISKEQLEKHLQELLEAKDRMLADLNAVLGHIEECQFWLDHIRIEESVERQREEDKKNGSSSSEVIDLKEVRG